MKKKLLSLMSLLTVGIMAWAFTPAAFYAPEGEDDGNTEPEIASPILGINIESARRMTITETGENEFQIETTGGDPYVSLTPLACDWTSDLTAVTFEYKLNQQAECEFFFSPYTGGNEQPFLLDAAEDWTVCCVSIASWREKLDWGKAGQTLRMDVGNDAGIVLNIRNIQPATTEAYEAYMSEKFGLTPIDGWYMLGSAQDLANFASLVNNGENAVNAKLTADIDLSEIEDWTSIASVTATAYAGVFDGEGHTITGFKKIAKTDGGGLFGYVFNGTVKNLTVDGDLTCVGSGGGVIAWTQGATVENVHSYLHIECLSPNTHHVGGVVGSARDNSVISNCSFHGTLYVGAGNDDCFGGITGYTNTAKFVNCANYGTITCDNPNCYCGGIFGYVNNADCQGLQNCLGAGKVTCTNGAGNYIGALVGWLRSFTDSRFSNNYWQEDVCVVASSGNDSESITKATAEQMASGEIAYLLNGDQSEIHWYQTIGKDDLPVLDPTHAVVLQKEDGTYWNEETGIQDLPMADNRSKAIFDLQGRRVSKATKGLYIVGNKKMLVK